MADLRAAAQQALEALEEATSYTSCTTWSPSMTEECEAAAAALCVALAEPVVNQQLPTEPVAWRWGYRSITTGEMDWRGYVEIAADPNLRSPAIIMQPLYTAPPQRKPLTEEEIRDLWSWAMTAEAERTATTQQHAFARAIERAHGITS